MESEAPDEVVPVHPEFRKWYRDVNIENDEDLFLRRSEGIRLLATKDGAALIEALVRLALKTRHAPLQEEVQSIRANFQEADDDFVLAGNDREMQVLAASTLAVFMAQNSDLGALSALAVTTASCNGSRTAELPMDLLSLAENALVRIADHNRLRPNLQSWTQPLVPKFDFGKSAAKARESNWEAVAQGFELAAETVKGAFKTVTNRHANSIAALDKFVTVQDEELQMLWWLVGDYSTEYDKAFNKVPHNAQPFVFTTELADATQVLPGPRSISALLSRAGIKASGKSTIPDAVNACEPEWLRRILAGEGNPSPVTMPIHFAIARHLETGGGTAWIAGWAAATAIDQTTALSHRKLAELFYRERLLSIFS